MTTAHFDASASSTPRPFAALPHNGAASGAVRRRIVRLIWLTALFMRRESVNFQRYHRRFGTQVRTFHRDIAALRDAGLYIDAARDAYRMTCFMDDVDAA
jgi:hypothetical protein